MRARDGYMKVRISYVVNLSDDYRRALRFREGREGLATRAEIKSHFMMHGDSLDDDLMNEWENRRWNGDEEVTP